MEEKVKSIVAKVNASGISDTEKAAIFAEISLGLRKLVWPVLIKHMPKDKLTALTSGAEPVTIDNYIELIKAAVADRGMFPELNRVINDTLVDVEAVLSRRGII